MSVDHTHGIPGLPSDAEGDRARLVVLETIQRLESLWEHDELTMRAEAENGELAGKSWRKGHQFGLAQAIEVVNDEADPLGHHRVTSIRDRERTAEERQALSDRVVIALHNENPTGTYRTGEYAITRRGRVFQRITDELAAARAIARAAVPMAAARDVADRREAARTPAPPSADPAHRDKPTVDRPASKPCLQREEADRER